MDRSKLLKMLVWLSVIVVIAAGVSHLVQGNSMSLAEYAELHSSESSSGASSTASGNTASASTGSPAHDSLEPSTPDDPQASQAADSMESSQPFTDKDPQDSESSQLTGAALNGSSQLAQRVSLTDDFYYEPLSDNLRRYITGISYPATDSDEETAALVVGYDDLRYVHVLHYDFDGNSTEGDLP